MMQLHKMLYSYLQSRLNKRKSRRLRHDLYLQCMTDSGIHKYIKMVYSKPKYKSACDIELQAYKRGNVKDYVICKVIKDASSEMIVSICTKMEDTNQNISIFDLLKDINILAHVDVTDVYKSNTNVYKYNIAISLYIEDEDNAE